MNQDAEHSGQPKRDEPRWWLYCLALWPISIVITFLVSLTVRVDPSPIFATLAVIFVVALFAVVFLLDRSVRKWRTPGRLSRFGGLMISLLLAGMVVVIFVPMLQRSRCGVWMLWIYHWDDSLHESMNYWLEERDGMPPRIAALAPYSHVELWNRDYFTSSPSTVVVGTYTLEDAQELWRMDDAQRLAALSDWEAQARLDPAGGDWEEMGPVLFSREEAAWRSDDKRVLVAFIRGMRRCGAFGPSRREQPIPVFCDAAGNVAREHDLETAWGRRMFDEHVSADREARAELGLSEPPDYAALIREYAEAQKDN